MSTFCSSDMRATNSVKFLEAMAFSLTSCIEMTDMGGDGV
jgi:hypothetical protein